MEAQQLQIEGNGQTRIQEKMSRDPQVVNRRAKTKRRS
jgi:hypothetical protein